jgi:hypothetical protein
MRKKRYETSYKEIYITDEFYSCSAFICFSEELEDLEKKKRLNTQLMMINKERALWALFLCAFFVAPGGSFYAFSRTYKKTKEKKTHKTTWFILFLLRAMV